jgi:hypothetical protein
LIRSTLRWLVKGRSAIARSRSIKDSRTLGVILLKRRWAARVKTSFMHAICQ